MSDETKTTGKDTLLGMEQSSTSGKGSTSEPRTYSEAEHQKIVSDTKAEAGRILKTAQTEAATAKVSQAETEKQLTATRSQLTEVNKRIDEIELTGAKDNPDALNVYQERRKLREREAELNTREAELTKSRAEHDSEVKVAKETQREIAIWEIAKKHSVDPAQLKGLNIESIEQVEGVAKAIAAGKPAPTSEETTKPDTARTTGSGEKTSEQKLKDRYPTMK